MGTPLSADTGRRIQRHLSLLGDPDQKVSVQAEVRLTRFGSKAVDALLEAASSPDPQVRFRVAWTLGKIRDPRALRALLAMTADPDERVAYDAVTALGDLGLPEVVPILQEIAGGPADDRSMDSAARSGLIRLGVLTVEDIDALEERQAVKE